jgi:YYY domain-containing protein
MEYGLVALWLLTYLVLGAVGLPVAAALLGRLPDDGASLALPTSLAVVSVVALWLGRLAFDLRTLAAALLVLVVLSAASLRRADLDVDWPVVGETAAVFTAAFLFLVAVRAVDPAVHPLLGEKFLDFGLLKSLERSTTLPPEDMWFAGEPVAYYYGGHLTTALLMLLTDTAPNYAYNLALAGFYGTYVTAAYGLGGAVAAARGASRRLGGLAAAFLIGFASNLQPVSMQLLAALPRDVALTVAEAVVGSETAPKVVDGAGRFGYWGASRVIPGTINEFPLFAWLNGDLHGHMMSTTFLLLVAGLLFAYYRTPGTALRRRRLLLFGAVPPVGGFVGITNMWSFPSVFGLTALALLFSPSDPVSLLPGPLATRIPSVGDADSGDGGDAGFGDGGDGGDGPDPDHAAGLDPLPEVARILVAGGVAAVVQLLAAVVILPFLLSPQAPWEIAVVADRSSLGGLLIVHGTFVAISAVYLLSRSRLGADERLRAVGAAAALLVVTALLDAAAVGLVAPLLLGAWVLARRDADVGFETVLVAGATGLLLVPEFLYVQEQAGPGRMNTVFKTYSQVWHMWGVAAGGMAATLAADYEAQVPWAVAAGVLVTGAARLHDASWLLAVALGVLAVSVVRYGLTELDVAAAVGDGGPERPAPDRSLAVSGLLALLLVSTSIYGGLAVDAHFAGNSIYDQHQRVDDPTLNATAFVAESHATEAPAIFWMDNNIEGQPTIVTAAPGGYYWTPGAGKGASAPSSLTGIPTVVGWYHEIGYRGRAAFAERRDDVAVIYTGDRANQSRLLRQYDVQYVYYGPAERSRYGPLQDRDALAGGTTVHNLPGVTVHEEWDGVTLYRVDQSELPAPAANETAGSASA